MQFQSDELISWIEEIAVIKSHFNLHTFLVLVFILHINSYKWVHFHLSVATNSLLLWVSHIWLSVHLLHVQMSVSQLRMICVITKCRFITFSDNYQLAQAAAHMYSGVVARSDKRQLSDKIRTTYFQLFHWAFPVWKNATCRFHLIMAPVLLHIN